MRFIGCKERLIDHIYAFMVEQGIKGQVFCDFFSGTTFVARYFKEKNFNVISSDSLYFSYVFQKAYLENNSFPEFKGLKNEVDISCRNSLFAHEETPLINVLNFLNTLPGKKGFIYKNYCPEGTKKLDTPRMYFQGANAQKIDAIRSKIEMWHESNCLTEDEYFVLLASLIEAIPFISNISGVYAAFLKTWDPRSYKKLTLNIPHIIKSELDHFVHHGDSMDMVPTLDCDILYVDPPYNSRQYHPNYHILETVARWDAPTLHGMTGMRNYKNEKSDFCNKDKALQALSRIIHEAQFEHFILSYNSEGIMPDKDILEVLSDVGEVVRAPIKYRRFKSNNNGRQANKKHIHELLYYLRKR